MSNALKVDDVFFTFPCLASTFVSELTPLLNLADFRDSYLHQSILSKYVGVGSVSLEELEQRAYKGVRESELRNRRTNARIASWRYRSSSNNVTRNNANTKRVGGLPLHSVLNTARQVISDTIGDFTYGIYENGRFTSGAAVGYQRSHGDLWYKYHGRVTCTREAKHHVLAFIQQHPGWTRHLQSRFGNDPSRWLKIVTGNKGFTIRKNAEEDRFACKEPTGNMLLQTSIGAHFRMCLRRVGINLNDQSVNRLAAFVASLDDGDSTIDLRKASDSCVLQLVRELFNDDWFRAMCIARSPRASIDGSPHEWEMISSMGNGFTFELESLIFYALSEAVRRLTLTPGKVLVYGDDIVVPQRITHKVIAVLAWAGFRTNTEKSFISGPFRESCGGHYYNGLDVTPFYIRKPITDTSRVIWLLNTLRKWCDVGGVCDPRFEALWKRWAKKHVVQALWGGKRYSSLSSLVTPHTSRGRLKLVSDDRQINGYNAVLRAYSFMKQRDFSLLMDGDSVNKRLTKTDGYQPIPVADPQVWYEMHGSVPITSDMTRICVVLPVVGYDADYNELYPDSYGLWPYEITRTA